MSGIDRSRRTKVLFWLYSISLAVAVTLMLWLFIVLASYYVADEPLAAPPLVRWMAYALVPLLALRLAFAWSLKRDRG